MEGKKFHTAKNMERAEKHASREAVRDYAENRMIEQKIHEIIKALDSNILDQDGGVEKIIALGKKLPPEVIEPEIQKRIVVWISDALNRCNFEGIVKISQIFNIPTENITTLARTAAIKKITTDQIEEAVEIAAAFRVADHIQEDDSEWHELLLNNFFIDAIETGFGFRGISPERIVDIFHVPDKILNDPRLQRAVERGVRNLFRPIVIWRDIDKIIKIASKFKLPTNTLQIIAQECIDTWNGYYSDSVVMVAKKLALPVDNLKIQAAVIQEVDICIFRRNVSGFKQLIDDFKIPLNQVTEMCKPAIVQFIKGSTPEQILELKNILKIDDELYIELARLALLDSSSINEWVKIRDLVRLPKNFFSDIELTKKITQILAEELVYSADVTELVKQVQDFGLSSDIYDMIDRETNFKHAQHKLLHFIPNIGDEKFIRDFPLTHKKILDAISIRLHVDIDLADYFIEKLDTYFDQPWVPEVAIRAVSHYSVAKKFVSIIEYGNKIWRDDAWVGNVLEHANAIITNHHEESDENEDGHTQDYGYGTEGFSEVDAYQDHPWRFDGQQVRLASILAELMTGQPDNQKLQELHVSEQSLRPLLIEANRKIESAYQDFLGLIRKNPHVTEEDKQALLDPESSSVKMKPLLNNVRAFIARYFVQSIEGDVTKWSEIKVLNNSLDQIIKEGFRRYIKIHEIDIPLYDKLYAEFDNLRETGSYPLEVFLGRDGIYAWIGRRAQDLARQRKMGLSGRKKQSEAGEVVAIHPQYTVYPRYFRDKLNYETRRKFLEQEGISVDADPLFYDTGYTGTIPEQIMKVMDFENEEIEKRIRLLSAPSAHRRVKGISENARSEIVEYIESNAKLEESAVGLIVDEKTGKIRHIAKPTNPEEQFYFMMVKQAIERHYWLKEKLHHEPSGNINLDSEHYTIRIRQDYVKLLPQEFLHDPKSFFTDHGELMKDSQGEGDLSAEELLVFRLTDGTEIVAKKIEVQKSKEARKEFSILIVAKKAGLPTADPVGFLSGKNDADGSYLLTKKIEGRSRRKFEKELKETGRYSEKQIEDILQQVEKKNKEMVELFRTTLKIDKRWKIKDTVIEFNEETGEVGSVIPIAWERVQDYSPNSQNTINEIG